MLGPWRERVVSAGLLSASTDGLSQRYASAARSAPALGEKEAAALFVEADAHLREEEAAVALRVAKEARARFQALGSEAGATDAFRLIAFALAHQGQRREAETLLRQELERLGGSSAEAQRVRLLLAEVGSEGLGLRACDEALASAKGTLLERFRSEGDRSSEALALLVVASCCLRRRDDAPPSGAREGLEAAEGALALFEGLQDVRGQAAALHWVAQARLRLAALSAAERERSGFPLEATKWLEPARKAAELLQRAGLRKLEAFERLCLARWLAAESPRKGLGAAEDALTFCQEQGSKREGEALAATVEAHLAIRDISKVWMRKEADEAARKAKAGAARLRKLGDKLGEGQALAALALAHLAREEPHDALAAAEAALKHFEGLEHIAGQSSALQLLTGLYLKGDQPDKALKAAKQLNAFSSSLHERAVALETIYEANLGRGDFRQARAAGEELLSLCEDEGEDCRRQEAMARLMISSVHLAEGDRSEAIAVAREAQAILNDLGATREEASALRLVAEVHADGGEHDAALRAADRALRLALASGDVALEAGLLLLVAQIRIMKVTSQRELNPDRISDGALAADAAHAAAEAVEFARRTGDERLVALGLCVAAEANAAGLRTDVAQRCAVEALQLFRTLGDEGGQARAMCLQADIQLVNGNSNRALQLADRALAIYQELGDTRGEWLARSLREHIVGPPAPAPELKDALVEGQQQWTEEHWRQWEEWQQQQQKQQGGGALQPLQRQHEVAAAPKKKRAPMELGAKLDMNSLREEDVQRRIEEIVRMTIDLDEGEDVYLDTPLMQMGVTSKTAVELRNAITEELPVQLPFTMVFDYPSISAMTDMIMENAGTVAG